MAYVWPKECWLVAFGPNTAVRVVGAMVGACCINQFTTVHDAVQYLRHYSTLQFAVFVFSSGDSITVAKLRDKNAHDRPASACHATLAVPRACMVRVRVRAIHSFTPQHKQPVQ